MDHINYIKASYSLYHYGHGTDLPHPRDIPPPSGGNKVAWIPQTMADSIWVVYSFKNKSDADAFIDDSGVHAKARKSIANRAFRKQWNISA